MPNNACANAWVISAVKRVDVLYVQRQKGTNFTKIILQLWGHNTFQGSTNN